MHAFDHSKTDPTPITDDTPIERIAILVAMMDEATPIITALQLIEHNPDLNPHLHLKCYRGNLKNRTIDLIVNGQDPQFDVPRIGTESAALCAYEVITKLEPDTLISAGTAGGYACKGATVGDIYIGSKYFSYHDRQVPINPAYEAYSRGKHSCLEAPALALSLNLKTGLISTGNSLSVSPTDQALIEQNGSVAKEMEVAAIANVARLFGVRVMGVKAITNLAGIDADAPMQFAQNFELATQKLAEALPKIIDHILGQTPKQLRTPLSLVSSELFPNKPMSLTKPMSVPEQPQPSL